ncbi:hypothetical protein Pla175_51490 [Pirellulimonas nuda]|uniref:N-acetyltransferase domain-containing protein n=1 Tax=Pirellulimonas nuda TaxID=2528009 RepID=A0A518DJR4_9BACT|nr:N-acetyltransferase [Pirellulimonas nuda]QDU91719.1 hypothetical protein Pla175_51490 [Pirellulimonas nuda]
MSQVEVVPVVGSKQQKQFLALPWKINAGDPNWVPPLRANQRLLAGFGEHPFYNDAQTQQFLALRGGKPVGRISAIINHAHNRTQKDKVGFFGFFESVDDPAVSGALFDAAGAWLAEREMTVIRGPANPSLNYEWSMLIDGFDTPPFFMMTHNPPYYPALVEASGFAKAQDLFAFYGEVAMLQELKKDTKVIRIDQQIRERFGVTVRDMDRSRFREEVEMFLRIYNEAMSQTWGHVPLSKAEIHHLAAELKHLIVPELAIVAEVEGEPVGVVFALLDYNTRIKKIDGRLYPFGFLRLLYNKRAIKRIRLVSTNVIPKYQSWGVGVTLAYAMLGPSLKFGIREAEFSWVLESNDLSRKSLEKGGALKYKKYRVYDKPLA